MKKEEKVAVALKYPEDADLPFISAKAKGKLAEKMIEIASEKNIPLVQDKIAANILSVSEIGSLIPEATWELVARIFALVVELEGKEKK